MVLECYEQEALARSASALQLGALHPLKTTRCDLPEANGSSQFELRALESDLPKHLRPSGPKPNPFLPWDPRLEVAQVGSDHALILNKYPVQLGHMLLVTRQWAAQGDWLQPEDLQALATVDQRTSGLWFFNSGPDAGASQPHRHIQLLPRRDVASICPREPWFLERLAAMQSTQRDHSRLEKAVCVHERDSKEPDQAGHLMALYQQMSQELGLGDPSHDQKPLAPYNLLLTRRWIALVRRLRDGCHGFSINALGFAGYLLTTQVSDQHWLNTHGPEQLLESVIDPFRDFSVAANG